MNERESSGLCRGPRSPRRRWRRRTKMESKRESGRRIRRRRRIRAARAPRLPSARESKAQRCARVNHARPEGGLGLLQRQAESGAQTRLRPQLPGRPPLRRARGGAGGGARACAGLHPVADAGVSHGVDELCAALEGRRRSAPAGLRSPPAPLCSAQPRRRVAGRGHGGLPAERLALGQRGGARPPPPTCRSPTACRFSARKARAQRASLPPSSSARRTVSRCSRRWRAAWSLC